MLWRDTSLLRSSLLFAIIQNGIYNDRIKEMKKRKEEGHDLALINRAGGLYGRILTEVVSTDRTQ